MSKGGRPKGEEWSHFTETTSDAIAAKTEDERNRDSGDDSHDNPNGDVRSPRFVTVCKHCGTTVSNKAARLRSHLKQCKVYRNSYQANDSAAASSPITESKTVITHEHNNQGSGSKRPINGPPPLSSQNSEPKRLCSMSDVEANDVQTEAIDLSTRGGGGYYTADTRQTDLAVARFLYGCGLPFNTVENSLFINLVASLNPRYKMPNTRMLAALIVDDVTGKMAMEEKYYKQLNPSPLLNSRGNTPGDPSSSSNNELDDLGDKKTW